MNWSKFRGDFRAFARLAHTTILPGEESRLAREAQGKTPIITCLGVHVEILALYAIWRLACWPESTVLVVTPTLAQAKRFFATAELILSEADEELNSRVLVMAGGSGLLCAESNKAGSVHCCPGTFGLQLPQAAENESPVTFVVPDLDKISGPHIREIPRIKERKNTQVIVNVVSSGRI